MNGSTESGKPITPEYTDRDRLLAAVLAGRIIGGEAET